MTLLAINIIILATWLIIKTIDYIKWKKKHNNEFNKFLEKYKRR